MSAFVVGKRHIDAMLTAGLRYGGRHGGTLHWFPGDLEGVEDYYRELRPDALDNVGAMLLDENIASVAYRYPQDTVEAMPGCTADQQLWASEGTGAYRHQSTRCPTPVETLSITAGYEYQSCEHPGWHESEAAAFIGALQRAATFALDGYSEAPMEWVGRDGHREDVAR